MKPERSDTPPAPQAEPAPLPDYHVHTVLCRHAEGRVADYVAAAQRQGVPELCFTDHAPAPDGYDAANRMRIDQFPSYREDVLAAQVGASPRVLFGIEADYYPEGVPFLREWLCRHPFDLVLGSVHYIGRWAFDNPDTVDAWDTVDVVQVWREYFGLIGDLADTRLYDVVGHLDLPKKFGHRIPEAALKEAAAPALDRLAAAGMAVEINTAGLRKPSREVYPSSLLLQLARERGIPICFGSDAHRPPDVGYGFRAAMHLARQAGYTHSARFRQRKGVLCPLPAA